MILVSPMKNGMKNKQRSSKYVYLISSQDKSIDEITVLCVMRLDDLDYKIIDVILSSRYSGYYNEGDIRTIRDIKLYKTVEQVISILFKYK